MKKTETNFPITISEIDQLELKTANLPEMIKFYGGILGCKIVQTSVEALTVRMGAGRTLIDLKDISSEFAASVTHNQARGYKIFLQLEAWNAEDIIGHFEGHGIKPNIFGARPRGTPEEQWITIQDPDGNIVNLKLGEDSRKMT